MFQHFPMVLKSPDAGHEIDLTYEKNALEVEICYKESMAQSQGGFLSGRNGVPPQRYHGIFWNLLRGMILVT